MWIQILVIFVLFVVLLYKGTRKPKRFPPGPPRLPIVGSMPYVLVRSQPTEPRSLMSGVLQGKTYHLFYIVLPKHVILRLLNVYYLIRSIIFTKYFCLT